jgi:hypothetical protein
LWPIEENAKKMFIFVAKREKKNSSSILEA